MDIVGNVIGKGDCILSHRFFSRSIIFTITCVLLLSGCMNQETPIEKMYQVLEEVVSAESVFEEQQDPLVTLEKSEKDIYNQIMAIGMKNHNEVVRLSNEALTMVGKREEHLQKEKESLRLAKKKFEQVADIKERIDDGNSKKLADELYKIMMQRYDAHDQLADEYSKALINDKELYTILKNKDLSFELLEEKITDLNQRYMKVSEANDEFNKLTKQYNDKKLSFYKESGLKLESNN
ncbi:MAG: Cell-wall binding lipoprotein YkyA [Neobacillus sp.]|nr:Cell-wall binding lipoprotein YkyA [Neobacillus sp.]